jgi:hypothetical protein
MGIKVSRLSHSTGQWRPWGGGNVEICGTALGVTIEFTRRVGRGSSTFQLEFDRDSLEELTAAIEASRSAATPHSQ